MFFQKPRKSKNALYYQKNQTKKLFGDFDVGMFFSPKMQPPKIAFINQIEPSIKSYEHFKF